jgi:hypothetical protein
MTDWYEQVIEEPIRETVRLLRDNGFNTTCSCGHDMSVECGYLVDGELQRLHNLLYNNGYRDYMITVQLEVKAGHLYQGLEITFPKEENYGRLPQ